MKNLFILFFPLISMAQKEIQKVEILRSDNQIEEFTSSLGNSELRVDFLDLLIFPALTIGYERTDSSYSGFGSTLFINLGRDDSAGVNWNDKFVLIPYYRFYFLQKKDFGGYGIFVEVFTKFSIGKYEKNFMDQDEMFQTVNYFDIAPGLAGGRKWINKKGFTFELLFGVGRNLLINSDEEYSGRSVGTVRAGVSVGKRF